MRVHVRGLVLFAVFLAVLTVLSCTSEKYEYGGEIYPSVEAALSAQDSECQAIFAQIEPVDGKIGGSLVGILPTDTFLFEKWGFRMANLPRKYEDYYFQRRKKDLVMMVEAVRKRNLFDSVELQQAENPEEVPFNEDFALVLPATRDAEWGIRVQGQDARVPTTIRLGPESQSHLQRLTTWLERIEKVARKSRQQEN